MQHSPPHAYLRTLRPDENHDDSAMRTLQIEGRGVAFFVTPLKDACDFKESRDGRTWLLTFFKNSPQRNNPSLCQRILVEFEDTPRQDRGLKNVAHWLHYNHKSDELSPLILKASNLIRNSETLQEDLAKNLTPERRLVADRKQLAYLSNSHSHFLRIVLCQALTLAYSHVLNQCMTDMVKHIEEQDTNKILKLYEDILHFNAAAYFSLPVEVDRHEMFAAWEVIGEHYQLEPLANELSQQLTAVAQLLSAKRDAAQFSQEKERERLEKARDREREEQEKARQAQEKERDRKREEQEKARDRKEQEARALADQKDKRRTFWLAIIGIVLTAASLAPLVQVTPQDWMDHLSAWLPPFGS